MKMKLPSGRLDALWEDPRNWRGKYIYFCREDPRLMVPKKQKWAGWTLNFARPMAAALLVLSLLMAILPTMFLAREGLVGSRIWYLFLAAFIAFVCIGSWILASPKRYEQ